MSITLCRSWGPVYFDRIDHEVLLSILGDHIHDERFLKLIGALLQAGYIEDWKFNKTLSGAPQGGVISPLLSSIYLHKFDQWVVETLLPAHTRGTRRKLNPAYRHNLYRTRMVSSQGKADEVKALLKRRRTLSSVDPNDETYRRLRYVRYADDFLLGFAGPKHEAENIKRQISEWLRDNLKLDLSEEKTLITHAQTQSARFLGYEISSAHDDDRRVINGYISLRMPAKVVEERCARYIRDGVIMHRREMVDDSDYAILTHYQQEYRGIVQYYALARNVGWLAKLRYVMETSLLKTLANKHRSTLNSLARKLRSSVQTPDGKTYKCLEVRVERPDKPPLIARFGGLSLGRQPRAMIVDDPFVDISLRNDLVQRLTAQRCELCTSTENVQVHHIRKMTDLTTKGRREKPAWAKQMAARRRKTLVVCYECHVAIHAGRPTRQPPK